jgi:hypothetical protein
MREFVPVRRRWRPATGRRFVRVPGYKVAGQTIGRMQDLLLIVRYTRRWLQYGIIGHAVLCILAAAVLQTIR